MCIYEFSFVRLTFHPLLLQADGCTTISGDVTISDCCLSDLHGLEKVTSIGGSLVFDFAECYSMYSSFFGALSNLVSVGGDLTFRFYDGISFSGLEKLEFVGGSLTLFSVGTSFSGFSGLDSLKSVGKVYCGRVPCRAVFVFVALPFSLSLSFSLSFSLSLSF